MAYEALPSAGFGLPLYLVQSSISYVSAIS